MAEAFALVELFSLGWQGGLARGTTGDITLE